MGIAPAGTDRANTGHHHLLINVDDIDLSKPIPLLPIISILEEDRLNHL